MKPSKALEIASSDLRFIDAAIPHPIDSPRVPLWPGIYRESSPGRWEPVSLAEWNELPPLARVDLVVAQMRQISRAIDDAGFVFSLESIDPESAAFSAGALRKGIHIALCRIYRELTRSDSLSTVGTLAATILLRLFFGDIPLVDESPTGAVALVLIYGEKFCGGTGETVAGTS